MRINVQDYRSIMRLPALLRATFFCGIATIASGAPVDPANFSESVYVSSSNIGNITGIDWAPDGSGRLFVTRKGGFSGIQTAEVRIVQNGAVLATPFAKETVYTNSECGLLGICFDPDFLNNHYVYFFVTSSSSEQRIVRYTDTNNVGTNRTTIITGLPTVGANHDGGAVGIGNDGKLYWAIGDNGVGAGVNADLTSLAAKIGRATRIGTVPNDNPFVDGAGPNNDFIWARGFRNPFSFTFQRTTGQLWSNTVGTNWEQVFLPFSGSHSGWNTYENNQPTGFLAPVIAYRTNGTDARTIAASGASRSGGIVTFTTTTPHPFHKGGQVTIAGVSDVSFNGTFDVATVLPGSPDPQISSQFTVVQAGADATSGGGTATTQNIGGAITGGCFYDSTAFPAAFHGNYFFGDYNSGRIMRVLLGGSNLPSHIEEFVNNIGSHVDMTTGPDGALYYADENNPGTIRRLATTSTTQNLIVQPTAFNVVEGSSSVFAVRLNSAPSTDVTVSVNRVSGDTDLSVTNGSSLTFTPANFATPQLVTISAAQDADTINDNAVFRVSAAGLTSYDVTVNGIDIPPPPVNAVSRKVHDMAGTFDIPLPLTGAPGIECRSGGATGDYQVIITFAGTVTVNGTIQADVTSGIGDVGTGGVPNGGAVAVNGAQVTVPLTNVANAQTIMIRLFDVHQGASAGDVAVQMSVLVGDTNGNGVVNASDISEIKAASGTAAASRLDVTVNGVVNSSDVALVKAKSGTGLPTTSRQASKSTVQFPGK
jgi:glucose/arabinose dehydrogenase